MENNYREAMKLANQLCFPLYAAARNVTNLYGEIRPGQPRRVKEAQKSGR